MIEEMAFSFVAHGVVKWDHTQLKKLTCVRSHKKIMIHIHVSSFLNINMDIIFLVGLLGSLVLVLGAAWPATRPQLRKISAKKLARLHPAHSIKNWLFALGGYMMLAYSILGYLNDGSVFFIFMQAFIGVSSIMMLLNTRSKISVPILTATGLAMIIWSLSLFEGYNTIFFILGLTGIAIGYALKTESAARQAALLAGSILIAAFSFIEASWIFFWLNAFFGLFSGYYMVKNLLRKKVA